MLLLLDYGIFYEFKNIKEVEKNYISLKDVKTKTDYEIIISTNSGLWRYRIGDIVRFTSISPYRIIIKGRTKSCINTFGEELMVHNTDQAIFEACKKTNCKIVEYTVAPLFFKDSSGAHEWAIEFENLPKNINLFSQILDQKLKKINSDYEAKRSGNLILREPKISIIKNGVFFDWLKKRNKLGGQNKIVRLSEKRKFIEELKKLNI